MICNCIHICDREADGVGIVPTMCTICAFMNGLNDPNHALPYAPPVFVPIEPSMPISNEQKDAAIDKALSEIIG